MALAAFSLNCPVLRLASISDRSLYENIPISYGTSNASSLRRAKINRAGEMARAVRFLQQTVLHSGGPVVRQQGFQFIGPGMVKHAQRGSDGPPAVVDQEGVQQRALFGEKEGVQN